MTRSQLQESPREERLYEILLGYVEALESGQAPDRRAVLAQHPEFARDLAEFFTSQDRLNRLAAPLRAFAGISDRSTSGTARRGPATDGPGRQPGDPVAGELGRLGDFQLIREVGRGGMGIVYEAEQLSLRRRVALKVLPFAAAFDPKQLQRFKNEAQAAALLNHPNIVPVFAIGTERGVHYFAMQLIDGQSLAGLLQELRQSGEPRAKGGEPNKKLDEALRLSALSSGLSTLVSTERSRQRPRYFQRVALLGLKAAQALDHAHQMGVVHRDVKPANLLIDVRGNLWITDFGLALFPAEVGLTMTGELLGTLRYMSPEQAAGQRALMDHRTDVYSLGATLYELLTLHPVFDGRDRHTLLRQIASEDPAPPTRHDKTIPAELETIVLKALAKHPSERYATAGELGDDLQRYLDCKPILARRPSLREKAVKWARRHQTAVIVAAVLLLVALAGLAVSTAMIAHEHAKTKVAFQRERQKSQEAADQRARAQEGFLQARRALDFITQISEEELVSSPRMQKLRKKLLNAALVYYRHFIEESRDDPSMQTELARSHSRLATILSELGAKADALGEFEQARQVQEQLVREHPDDRSANVRLDFIRYHLYVLQGCAPMALLIRKSVQDDLALSAAQVRQVQDLAVQLTEQRQEVLGDLRTLSGTEQQARLQELAQANDKAVTAIIMPTQRKRLDQIGLQAQSYYAFSAPRVVEALGLTSEQKTRIGEQQAEAADAIWEFLYPTRPGAARPQPAEIRSTTLAAVMRLLSPEQQARWRELTGRPFQGDLYLGQRGISTLR